LKSRTGQPSHSEKQQLLLERQPCFASKSTK